MLFRSWGGSCGIGIPNSLSDAYDWCDAPQFGISEPPPPLPGFSASVSAPASSDARGERGEVCKVLSDMPGLEWGGNKTPWELGVACSTWKRQVCTVAGTVDFSFMWKSVSWMLSEGIRKNLETRSRIH